MTLKEAAEKIATIPANTTWYVGPSFVQLGNFPFQEYKFWEYKGIDLSADEPTIVTTGMRVRF